MIESSKFNNLFKGDNVIWIIYLLLNLISIVEVFSASSRLSFGSGNYLQPINQHCTMLGVGFVVVYLTHHIPYKYFKLLPYFLLPISCMLLLAVMILGIISDVRVNGASRWIFGFQPSELAKMSVIIAVAHLLSKYQREDGCSPKAFKPILTITLITFGLIAPENGSTALLLAGVVFLMMIIARVPYRQLIRLVVVSGTILLLFGSIIMITPASKYRNLPLMHRVETWQNRILNAHIDKGEIPPEKFDLNKNGQVANANIAIATSHIIGKGPGNSDQRDHLSHGYSDFIYAIIIEEMGLLGGLFVVMLYLWLLIRTYRIASKCNSYFPAFLCIGLCLLLVTQAMTHMAVCVQIIPVTGQPLPLISKGGTSILFNCIYIGMILSISNHRSGEQYYVEKYTNK